MKKITTEVILNTSVEKAWEHYTNPKSIQGWAFASDDWECPNATNDLRVGGKFLTRMQAKDKSFGFDFTGVYTEVENLKRIAYSMDKSPNEKRCRECEILFETLGKNTTKVFVNFDPEDINPIEMQKTGWQSILDNFKKFVEAN